MAFYQPGDAEKEKAFNPRGEATMRDREFPRVGVRSRKWFSFDLPVASGKPALLVVTYNTEERARRSFEVLVNGERVGDGTIPRSPPGNVTGHFYDVNYTLPPDVFKDQNKLTVKFQAVDGDETATVFGVRLVGVNQQ